MRWKERSEIRRGRRHTLRRDGHRCRICGSTEKLTIHHLKPRALGGTMDITNLVTLCEEDHTQIEQVGRYAASLVVWAIGRPLLALARIRLPIPRLAVAAVAALLISHVKEV